MRGRRCVSCGERFYAAPGDTSKECQTCTGDYDPSAQAISDTANIEAVNDIRNLTTGKQTLDIKALADAAAAPKKSRKAPDDAPQS